MQEIRLTELVDTRDGWAYSFGRERLPLFLSIKRTVSLPFRARFTVFVVRAEGARAPGC